MARYLLSLEIATPSLVWNRAVVTNYVPEKEDLQFYYRQLLGLANATVALNALEVPSTFNDSLLSTGLRIPTQFPVHDLETPPENAEKRRQYATFLQQLCDVEKSRAALQVFAATEDPTEADAASPKKTSASLLKTRAWVQDLLRSLHADETVESSDLVPAEIDAFVPIGWIFTPVVADVRDTRGSRIVLDPALGSKWERLLGTDVFPDMVVSRRISTQTWAFQHATSDSLVKATLEWYLASQDATIKDGMSGWIQEADKEMTALFATFKRIKVNEKLMRESLPKSGDKQSKVFTVVSTVEARCLASALEHEEVEALSMEQIQRFMKYVFRGFGIPKETAAEGVQQIYQRWVHGNLGFRPDATPILESWTELWNVVMRGRATREHVDLFLKTMDCWDPLEAGLMTATQRKDVESEWVKIFIDNMLTSGEKKDRLPTIPLYKHVEEWCKKYLPVGLFASNFSPAAIGPVFTIRGFNKTKASGGRFMLGLKYKHPECAPATVSAAETESKATTAVAVTVSKETRGGVTEETRSVRMTAESDGGRIEHFFAATTQEIHLGDM